VSETWRVGPARFYCENPGCTAEVKPNPTAVIDSQGELRSGRRVVGRLRRCLACKWEIKTEEIRVE
jgi:hypothetical protein